MLDVIVFLLYVPVCPAEPAKIGRKESEIILPYTLFHCPPQAAIPLLDLSATCITCPQTGAQKQSPYECLEQPLPSCCGLAGGLLFVGALPPSLHYSYYYWSKEVSTKHPAQGNLC